MSKILTCKQENERIKLEMIKLYDLEQRYKQAKQEYEAQKKPLVTEIKNFMFINKDLTAVKFLACTGENFSAANKVLKVALVKPASVVWNLEKLKRFLGRVRYSKLVDKTYEIIDMPGLIKYLKSCGVDPEKFKEYLQIDEKVNEETLKQMSSLGELSAAEIKGCYELKYKESYLRFSFPEEDKEE